MTKRTADASFPVKRKNEDNMPETRNQNSHNRDEVVAMAVEAITKQRNEIARLKEEISQKDALIAEFTTKRGRVDREAQQRVAESQEKARRIIAEAEEQRSKADAVLREAELEAERIRSHAHTEADSIIENRLMTARRDIEDIERQREAVKRETLSLIDNIEKEYSTLIDEHETNISLYKDMVQRCKDKHSIIEEENFATFNLNDYLTAAPSITMGGQDPIAPISNATSPAPSAFAVDDFDALKRFLGDDDDDSPASISQPVTIAEEPATRRQQFAVQPLEEEPPEFELPSFDDMFGDADEQQSPVYEAVSSYEQPAAQQDYQRNAYTDYQQPEQQVFQDFGGGFSQDSQDFDNNFDLSKWNLDFEDEAQEQVSSESHMDAVPFTGEQRSFTAAFMPVSAEMIAEATQQQQQPQGWNGGYSEYGYDEAEGDLNDEIDNIINDIDEEDDSPLRIPQRPNRGKSQQQSTKNRPQWL